MSEIAAEVGLNKSSVSRHFSRHLNPALTAVGASPGLPWNVERKSRELSERMEMLLTAITVDCATSEQLMERWQAIRGIGQETREWMKLHGAATGELARDSQNNMPTQVQIILPWTNPGSMPRVRYTSDVSDSQFDGLFTEIAVR